MGRETLLTRKHRLISRISELCGSLDKDLRHAWETYFENHAETYFDVEEKLLQMKTLFETIRSHVHEATTLADVLKASERVQYVEERLDEVEYRLYPRRRRKKRRLFDFFARYHEMQQGGYNVTLKDAYAELGLPEGTSLLEATATFRRMAKKYHPDVRGGDRSQEEELRRIVMAYQYIKDHFAQKEASF